MAVRLGIGLALFITFQLLCGCAHSVSIRTDPIGAEIYVQVVGESQKKLLGKSPLEVSLSQISRERHTGPISFLLEKEGFVPQNILVPYLPLADLQIAAFLSPKQNLDFRHINKVVSLILRGERALIERRLEEALSIARNIRQIDDNIAAAYQIEGSAYLMLGRLVDSRSAWQRVVTIQPDNAEAISMMRKFESGAVSKELKPLAK